MYKKHLTYCKIYTKIIFGNVAGNVPEKFSTIAGTGVKFLPEIGKETKFFEKTEPEICVITKVAERRIRQD